MRHTRRNNRNEDRGFIRADRPQPKRAVPRSAGPSLHGRRSMGTWTPDPSFYPSPRMAARAPAEGLAYVAAFDPERQPPDEIAVVDLAPASSSYSQIVGRVAMPNAGDELHHFGWNACSSCLCPNA